MKINSIFQGIEGEGMQIGIPKTFIRLQGCSMKCKHCDTPEAQNFKEGKDMTPIQIVNKVRYYYQKYISITGGNPLEQDLDDLYNLVRELKKKHYKISIEVTGNEEIKSDISKIFNIVDFISFDMKSPSSKCKKQFHKSSVGWCHKAQYKIVVADWSDYVFAKKMITKYKMCKIILTPCWNTNSKLNKKFAEELYRKVLRDNLRCRVIIQQHKIVYGADKKNV